MKLVFSYIFIFLSLLTGETGSFEKGVAFYDSRSEGAVGYNVKADPIENAIKQFKKASTEFELDAGVYLMRSYYFKGKFISKNDEEKKKVFSKGKDLGEKLKNKKISNIIFDRNGYNYHGRVKALAEAVREMNIKF